MTIRLGEILVEQGAMSVEQCQNILDIQRVSHRPFGVIAEKELGISPQQIEQAWAAQYAMIAVRVDPLSFEIKPNVLEIVTKRQAWQFGFIPIRVDDGELECVTAMECLSRALRFVGWRLNESCSFSICDLHTLKRGLAMHYPFKSMDMDMADQYWGQKPAA